MMSHKETVKENPVKKKSFRLEFRGVLVVLFLMLGLLPAAIYTEGFTEYFAQIKIEELKNELRERGGVLSSRLSAGSYTDGGVQSPELEAQVGLLGEFYKGRVMIVDRSYRIIFDTFQVATGKLLTAQEVIRSFSGESINRFDDEKQYIVQTMPIYGLSEEITGVLLISASTKDVSVLTERISSSAAIFHIILFFVLLFIAIFLSGLLLSPFQRLREAIAKIAGGDLSYNIEEGTYTLTKHIAEDVNSTLEKLRVVNQSRDEFVANVSHELKTPITSIRVLADSLLSMEEAPVELYKEFMQDISVEIDRQSKIIEDLLALVRLDKADTEMGTNLVSINELLRQILKRLRPIASQKNIEITLESIREVEAEVDEMKLSLAISNLVENAIKYNVPDGWVKVSLDADHKFFYIKISDSGIGIAPEHQEAVFERFYRVDKARTRESGGTGLGLSITRNIILRHKGIIKVSGKEGEGSVFMVRIPLNYIK